MRISVIIPAYNEEFVISKTLLSLFSQSISDYEIIVVDDGSTDNTYKILKDFQTKFDDLKVFRIKKNRGRSAARNIGIKKARKEVLVFLDADIQAPSNLLKEHLNWHKKHPLDNYSMVGKITWSSEIEVTSFMHWLEHGGEMLDFDDIKHGAEVTYRHFYTGNASVKRKYILKSKLFDEDFGKYYYEDLELAYRLHKDNFKIFFNSKAVGYHTRTTDPEAYDMRMAMVGIGAKILLRKHPELAGIVALSRHSPRTLLNQLFSPLYFLIGRIFNTSPWMGYYYNARFFRKYLKSFNKA